MIRFENVSKVYKIKKNKNVAINDVSFSLPNKGLVFIIGKSGSGKSTLLNLLGCLDKPDNGKILLDGNDISRLKGSELTSYRNGHIGFVFQDFNLLEDLNVYENVKLALDLKREKDTREKVLEVLKSLEIEHLEKRRINEISGGEKQRVAIARAIIKRPKILLCDEPTGNLDSNNSMQIFDILKDISSDTLVIVVTHDAEAARKYSKNIIELLDGKIVKNTVLMKKDTQNDLKLKNRHLSIFRKLKLSYLNLRHKKIRLVLTIILSVIGFTCFGISNTLNNYDEYEMHAETMVKEKEDKISITKYYNFNHSHIINSKDLNIIDNRVNSKRRVYSSVYEEDYKKSLSDSLKAMMRDDFSDKAFYGSLYFGDTYFAKYSSDEIKKLEIVGNYPGGSNEVLISEIFAEYLLSSKFVAYNDKEKLDFKLIDKKEEVVGLKIPFGSTYLIISGYVVDPMLEKFESLKNLSKDEMDVKPTELYKDFVKNYIDCYGIENLLDILYVDENFFDTIEFKGNYEFAENYYEKILTFGEHRFFKAHPEIISMRTKVFNGSELVEIDNLNEDEIVLSVLDVIELFDKEYNDDWIKARDTAIEKYKKEKAQYDAKVLEYEQISLDDPEFEWPVLVEPEKPDFNEIEQNVLRNILKRNNVFGNTIDLEIIDEANIVQEEKSKIYSLKVVGLVYPEEHNFKYYGKTLVGSSFDKYRIPNETVVQIDIFEPDSEKLEKILANFKDEKRFEINTKFSSDIKDVSKMVRGSLRVMKLISLVFLIFATVLMCNFIYTSIGRNSKDIGILRSLGARTKDCVDIYLLENIILGVSTFLISGLFLFVVTFFANSYVTNLQGFYLRVFKVDYRVFGYMGIVMVLAVILSSILPIIRLSKMKPVNVINKI